LSVDKSIAIRCDKVSKRFGALVAVNELTLELRVGSCLGLLGPNGAGKTTTVEMIEGLTAPSSGVIEVLGQRWGQNDNALRQELGVSLQETELPEQLTVKETLELFSSFYPKKRGVSETLALMDLEEKRDARVGKLSGGQRQRLALACALVGRPKILFLDEPTTGLDPQARRSIWGIVKRFKEEGGTVLLTTHYMEEAEQLCDEVAIIDHGKLLVSAAPDAMVEALGVEEIVTTRRPTLEDVFLHHTGRSLRDA